MHPKWIVFPFLHVIDMASKLLDNAIMLTNSSYRVIAMSSNEELNDPHFNEGIRNKARR
ncbi:hypothetical protein IIK_05563 [Bacillus cereus VD102]|nr:hypothetical protein IIK_05563 [Bacillus cereus VD102]